MVNIQIFSANSKPASMFMTGCWLIHRHCPNPKTCLWQKLRCPKMILQHILSQFTKFVIGDLKYMTRYLGNYNVCLFCFRLYIWYWHPYPFYPFVPVPARTRTSIHSTKRTALTAINVTSSRQLLGSADWLQHYLLVAQFYVLACTLYTSFVYTVWCSVVF